MRTYTPKDTSTLRQLVIVLLFPWCLAGALAAALIEKCVDVAFGVAVEWVQKEHDIDRRWK